MVNKERKWEEELCIQFSKEDIEANSHMKKCSVSLKKEIQIRITVSYTSPMRMVHIKETRNKCWGG